MILTRVDLPAPLSPSSATTSPRPISKLMPRSAWMAPKFLVISSSCSSGVSAITRPPCACRDRARAFASSSCANSDAEARRQHAGHGQGRGAAQHGVVAILRPRDARRVAVAALRDGMRQRLGGGDQPGQQRLLGGAAEDDGLRIEQILDGHDGGAQQRRGFGDPAIHADLRRSAVPSLRATDSARGSRDCRRGKARRSGPAAHARSRRRCRRRRAPARLRAPGSRRGRRRNRDSRSRASPARRHRAVRPGPRPPDRPRRRPASRSAWPAARGSARPSSLPAWSGRRSSWTRRRTGPAWRGRCRACGPRGRSLRRLATSFSISRKARSGDAWGSSRVRARRSRRRRD